MSMFIVSMKNYPNLVCNITVGILEFIQNNESQDPCDIVIGNFILGPETYFVDGGLISQYVDDLPIDLQSIFPPLENQENPENIADIWEGMEEEQKKAETMTEIFGGGEETAIQSVNEPGFVSGTIISGISNPIISPLPTFFGNQSFGSTFPGTIDIEDPIYQPQPPIYQPLFPINESLFPINQPQPPIYQPLPNQPLPPINQPQPPFIQPQPPIYQPLPPINQPLFPMNESLFPINQPLLPVNPPLFPINQPQPPIYQPQPPIYQPPPLTWNSSSILLPVPDQGPGSSYNTGLALERIFGNLVEIRGCLQIVKFIGNKNLFFLGKLKRIICTDEQAAIAGIRNVINITNNPSLEYMGLNSLETVEGPGNIVIKYDITNAFGNIYAFGEKGGIGCYTKQELLFYAKHKKFRGFGSGSSPPACEVDDPCLKASQGMDFTTDFSREMPNNCTLYMGNIWLRGPFTEGPEFDNYSTIEVIYGKLIIESTAFEDFNIFPNLIVIYDENEPLFGPSREVNERKNRLLTIGFARNTRLKKISMPKLSTDFTLTVTYACVTPNDPACRVMEPNWGKFCDLFPQFVNGSCVDPTTDPFYLISNQLVVMAIQSWSNYLSPLALLPGLFLCPHVVVLIVWGSGHRHLGPFRLFYAAIILVFAIWAVELYLILEDFRTAEQGEDNPYYPVPVIRQAYLVNDVSQFIAKILAALRHTLIPVVPLLYLERIFNTIRIFFPLHSQLFAKIRNTCFYIILCFLLLLFFYFFNSFKVHVFGAQYPVNQIVFRQFDYVWSLFVLHKDSDDQAYIIEWEKKVLLKERRTTTGLLLLNTALADISGTTFPNYFYFCDWFLFITASLFHLVCILRPINHNNFIYILLYIHLNIYRIRPFLIFDVLRSDFCEFREVKYTLFDFRSPGCYIMMNPIDPRIVFAMLTKLPYLTFSPIIFLSWRYVIFYYYRGELDILREHRVQIIKNINDSEEFTLSTKKNLHYNTLRIA